MFHASSTFVAGLRRLRRVLLIIELDGAHDGEVACAASDLVEMLDGNQLERALTGRCPEARFDRSDVRNANFAKHPMLRPKRLIQPAGERAPGGRKSAVAGW